MIQTRSVVRVIFDGLWESLVGGALLAACKTLAFPQKLLELGSRAQSRDAAVVLQLSLVVRLLGRDGLWRLERRLKPCRAGARHMATE